MRVLFVCVPHKSHVYQVVTLGWALRAAGNEVIVSSAPDPGLAVQDMTCTGLSFMLAGESVNIAITAQESSTELDVPIQGSKPSQSDYALCDTRGELETIARNMQRSFSLESMVAELVRLARSWRPDLVIWDNLMTFAGPVVARACGAASARLLYCPDAMAQLTSAFRGKYPEPDPFEAVLRARFERVDLDFDQRELFGDWTISCMPWWTWHPAGVHHVQMRPLSFNGPSPVPEWLAERPSRRRVCITLGLTSRGIHSSVPPVDSLFKAVSGLDVEVIATLPGNQLAALDELPDNVRVTEFVPLNMLLSTCAAIIHHGGAGTAFSALEHGVPQIIMPSTFSNEKWWGQVAHAEGVEQQGAGIHIDTRSPVSADELRDHLSRVLEDSTFLQNAARLRSELMEMPAPSEIVPALTRLTAEHRTSV
jgi:hypothetical protein